MVILNVHYELTFHFERLDGFPRSLLDFNEIVFIDKFKIRSSHENELWNDSWVT